MKKFYTYLASLGFDLTDPGPNHFGAFKRTDADQEVKTLYLHKTQDGSKNLVSMCIYDYDADTFNAAVIAMQSIATPAILRQHMLNSYRFKKLCPVLYQKVLEKPA